MYYKELIGEFIGTFMLVFIGCSSIIMAVVFGWMQLLGVALIWGAGVTLAIYTVKSFSHAHLNPAVTLSLIVAKKLEPKKFLSYTIAQTTGAFLAALLMYLLFKNDIIAFEATKGLVRGDANSILSAQFFGEFYPNPSYTIDMNLWTASSIEFAGTFFLVLVIFSLDWLSEKWKKIAPVLIGATVTSIILVIAPYTQAGINPARDFGPRMFAYFGGWEQAAFPNDRFGFLIVYILAPLFAGFLAAYSFKKLTVLKK